MYRLAEIQTWSLLKVISLLWRRHTFFLLCY